MVGHERIVEHDRFLLRQRIRPMVNQYEFSVPDADGRPGEVVCFAEQARMKFKEDIRFYTDDSKSTEVMRLKARQRFDPAARYDVTDARGAKIGEIQKAFKESLLRSTYVIYDAEGEEVARASERSRGIALFRRGAQMVSDYGDFLPIPYHFDFKRGDELLGTNERVKYKMRDTYALDFSHDAERVLDRRLALVLCVAMDALQAR